MNIKRTAVYVLPRGKYDCVVCGGPVNRGTDARYVYEDPETHKTAGFFAVCSESCDNVLQINMLLYEDKEIFLVVPEYEDIDWDTVTWT